MDKNPLIGKIVTAVWLADDKKAIRFDVGGEHIIAKADGDCCSSTWIESFDNPDALVGAEVVSAEDVGGIKPAKDDGDGSVVAFYGFKIATTKGVCVLDYRNESNGYYGGNLAWPGDYFYGGVYGQNESKEDWRLLVSVDSAGKP
jgi:hypothetical protein